MLDEKITVIVTAYNQEKYIDRCMQSILKQTYKNLDIIVIDDGSTDETTKIVKKYQNTKIYSKPNEGIYSARNLGISLCKTKYFMFVDSDDYLEPNAIEILYKAITSTNSDIAMGMTYNSTPQNEMTIISNDKYEYLFNNKIKYFITAWNKLYKTSLFKDLQYKPLKLAEDEYIIHHILRNMKRMVVVPQKTYNYFINSNGLSTKVLENYKDALYAFKDRYEFLKQTDYKNLAYTKYMNYCIKIFCELKIKQITEKSIVKEFRCNYKENFNLKYSFFYLAPNTYYKVFKIRRKIWKK